MPRFMHNKYTVIGFPCFFQTSKDTLRHFPFKLNVSDFLSSLRTEEKRAFVEVLSGMAIPKQSLFHNLMKVSHLWRLSQAIAVRRLLNIKFFNLHDQSNRLDMKKLCRKEKGSKRGRNGEMPLLLIKRRS